MKANRFVLHLRALTTASSSSASHTRLNSTAAAIPKKKWKPFSGDPPPPKSMRPKTIPWKEDICNSASFIGTVDRPVKRVASPAGVGACTSLLVKVSSDPNRSFRILLKMWDEMAEMCLEHIKENDFLHVSGRVESYSIKIDEKNISQKFYEVNVKEINYVAESEHSPINKNAGKLVSGESEHSPINKNAGKLVSGESEHSPINKNAGKLVSGGESSLEKYRARLHLWQLFFTKPSEWHDCRKKKVKPKHPDFKHKDTGEALWINNRDPPWVKVQLERLDSKLAAENRNRDSTSKFSTVV